MQDRIRAELTSHGRLEDALLQDHSYISTLHAFGLRILTEFAFDCSISPSPRLLNEDEEATPMRRASPATDRADEVMEDAGVFGYPYDFTNGKGAETQFRDAVLKLLAKLCAIGRLGEDPLLLPQAERLITELYGEACDAECLENTLHDAVLRLLKGFPADLTEIWRQRYRCEVTAAEFARPERCRKRLDIRYGGPADESGRCIGSSVVVA